MNHCNIERINSAEFLKWISSEHLTNDFECLKTYLDSGYPDIESFIPNFLTGSMPRIIGTSSSSSWQKSAEVPKFYSFNSNENRIPFKDLFQPNQKIDESAMGQILNDRYNIPSFFSIPILYQIEPKLIQSHHKYIRFSALIPLGELLDTKQFKDQVYTILCYGKNRNYVVSDDIGFYIVRYLQTNKKFALCLKNKNECSIFLRYILMNLILVYDPEFRGRITRQNFVQLDFLKILDEASDFDRFKEILSLFDSLDIQKKSSLSFKELLQYDHKRVHPKVLERVWKFLPGTKVNERITFGDFVSYIMLLEIKESQAALNFWFRVCDIEEDGILSLNEMYIWYKYQKQMLKERNTETEKFKQLVPQIMDMMGTNATQWTRNQIRESGAWPRLFNILIDPKIFYGYFELKEDKAVYK